MALEDLLPELIVGFDTETTGLDTAEDEIISYGFAVFRHGQFQEEESGQFFATTERPIHPRAQEIHGLSADDIRSRTSKWGGPYSPSEGLRKAIDQLLIFKKGGAVIVGAFPKFDFDMLHAMSQRHLRDPFDWTRHIEPNYRLESHELREFQMYMDSVVVGNQHSNNQDSSTNASSVESVSRTRAMRTNRPFRSITKWPFIVDVCAFDRNHWPDLTRRRSLGALCDYYNVAPGGHDALQDARAAVEVWMQQISARHTEVFVAQTSSDTDDSDSPR